MNSEADLAIIEKVRRGDIDAYGVLVERYQDRIFSVVFNYVPNREDAADIVQDSFVKAYTKLQTFDSESAFYTWLYRIAINAAIDYLRKKKSRNVDSLDDEKFTEVGFEPVSRDASTDPERVVLRSEQAAILRRALGALSDKLKAVAILHDVEGLSQEEVARVLGIPVGTVKSRVSRARAELRYLLRSQIGEMI